MKFTCEATIMENTRTAIRLFEFHAKSPEMADKLMRDYCSSLGISLLQLDIEAHPQGQENRRHKW